MGRGRAIGEEAREVIYRVYLYFAVEAEKFKTDDGYFQRIQQRVANATGVSVKFVYLLVKDKGKYGSEEFKLRNLTTLKRKLDEDDSETSMTNDGQNKAEIEKVFLKPDPIAVQQKSPEMPKRTLLESVLTSPYPGDLIKKNNSSTATVTTGPKIIKVRSLAQSPQSQSEISILPTTQFSTIPFNTDSMPTIIKAHQTKSRLDTPQVTSPVNAFIKVHTITQNAVPKPVLASVSSVVSHKPRAPGPEFIKVYPIPRDQVPRKVLEKANKASNPHSIEIKTVPIEFDPGSFSNEIKTEPEDVSSD